MAEVPPPLLLLLLLDLSKGDTQAVGLFDGVAAVATVAGFWSAVD